MSAPANTAPSVGATRTQRVTNLLMHSGFMAIWAATALLFVVSPLLADGTLGQTALLGMLPFAAILAIAALGQALVIMQGGLDLSVPGVISISAVVVTKYSSTHGDALVLALLLALAVASLAGLVNGLAITVLGITPLIATLGTNALLTAAVLQYSGGNPATSPDALSRFALAKTVGVPNTVLVALVLLLVVSVVLRRTVLGRRFQLVGTSVAAAEVAGIRGKRYRTSAYVGAGLCYGAAGVLAAGFLQTPSLQVGDPYLLPTVAAVVLGGASLAGGQASIAATAGGALFLSQLDQVVQAMGAATSTQYLVQGGIIGLGVGIRGVPWSRIAGRKSRPQGGDQTASPHGDVVTQRRNDVEQPDEVAHTADHR